MCEWCEHGVDCVVQNNRRVWSWTSGLSGFVEVARVQTDKLTSHELGP